jgi:L-rhamnose-H+ transport protein
MSIELAILLVALGGILEGLFSIPVTRTPRWEFENIWFVGSLAALVIIPWPLVYLTVPDVGALYRSVPSGVLVAVILSGLAWGIGGIFWGRAIGALGMALGVSLLMGLINVFGSIGPMAIFDSAKILSPGGLTLLGALAIMILGVVVIALAGRRKDEELRKSNSAGNTPFWLGLLFCLLSGILSAGVNFGFVFGAPLAAEAGKSGVPAFAHSFAVWSLVFTANYLVNAIYGLVVMLKRGTLRKLVTDGCPSYWLGAVFMGLAWPGGIIVYGIGAGGMGSYGAYVGFPMMILTSILAGNAAGALGGEWRGTSMKPRRTMAAGILILFIAFALLGYSNQLLAHP